MTEQLPSLTWEEEDTLRQNYRQLGRTPRAKTKGKSRRGSQGVRDKYITRGLHYTFIASFYHPVDKRTYRLGRYTYKDDARAARDLAHSIIKQAMQTREGIPHASFVKVKVYDQTRHLLAGRKEKAVRDRSRSFHQSYTNSTGPSVLLSEAVLNAPLDALDLKRTLFGRIDIGTIFRYDGAWYIKRNEKGRCDYADREGDAPSVTFRKKVSVLVARCGGTQFFKEFGPALPPHTPLDGFSDDIWRLAAADP